MATIHPRHLSKLLLGKTPEKLPKAVCILASAKMTRDTVTDKRHTPRKWWRAAPVPDCI